MADKIPKWVTPALRRQYPGRTDWPITPYKGSWAHQMATGALRLPPLTEKQQNQLRSGVLIPGDVIPGVKYVLVGGKLERSAGGAL